MEYDGALLVSSWSNMTVVVAAVSLFVVHEKQYILEHLIYYSIPPPRTMTRCPLDIVDGTRNQQRQLLASIRQEEIPPRLDAIRTSAPAQAQTLVSSLLPNSTEVSGIEHLPYSSISSPYDTFPAYCSDFEQAASIGLRQQSYTTEVYGGSGDVSLHLSRSVPHAHRCRPDYDKTCVIVHTTREKWTDEQVTL
jgi:hypothetical protein